jgi:hypothetical protein
MGNPIHYACCGKEMLDWIREKLATQESALGGSKFFAFIKLPLKMAPQLIVTRAL